MKVFTEMLFADQLRGSDGTGIMYNNKDKIKVLKGAIASSDFVNNQNYDKAAEEIVQKGTFVVGHNRSATKGKLSHENTHPFREGPITLVHNGTLHYHQNLADTEVDSHAICVSIAKIGYKETLKKINGAFALIWTDSRNKTINFVRNSQRPLFIVETGFLFILVSEKGLAEWILDRNNQTVLSVKEVPVGMLHQFELSDLTKYHTEKVDFYSYTPVTYPSTSYTPISHLTDKSKTVVLTKPALGDKLRFIPVDLDHDNKTKIVGEWEDSVTGESIEVRYWARDEKDALELIDKTNVLEGYVSHIAYPPLPGKAYLVMRNVYKVNLNPELKAKNGFILEKSDLSLLDKKCSCCNVSYSEDHIKENIKDMNLFLMLDNTIEYTCSDCTQWLEEPLNSRFGAN